MTDAHLEQPAYRMSLRLWLQHINSRDINRDSLELGCPNRLSASLFRIHIPSSRITVTDIIEGFSSCMVSSAGVSILQLVLIVEVLRRWGQLRYQNIQTIILLNKHCAIEY